MAFCPKCGKEVADGTAFCPGCGAPQSASAAPAGGAPAAGNPAASTGGLESHVAAALGYIWIIAIVWLLVEPYNKDRFVRFHAFQALGLCVVWLVGWFVFALIPFLGWIAAIFWPLVIFVTWVLCVVNALQKKWFKLPLIGDFAMQQAGPAQS